MPRRSRARRREPRQGRKAIRRISTIHALVPVWRQPSRVDAHDGRRTPPAVRAARYVCTATRHRGHRLTGTDSRYGGQQRHHSVSEYDGMRSHSASNAQGFYQNQRFAPRPNDADQMAQAKRRMAAQRERELRNYHQEQQYHRSKDSESGQQ